MHLYFHELVRRSKTTYLEFFETAYMWRFGKQGFLHADYSAYVSDAVLPRYVVEYVQFLMKGESHGSSTLYPVFSEGVSREGDTSDNESNARIHHGA